MRLCSNAERQTCSFTRKATLTPHIRTAFAHSSGCNVTFVYRKCAAPQFKQSRMLPNLTASNLQLPAKATSSNKRRGNESHSFSSSITVQQGFFRAPLDRCHLPCYATIENISRHQKTLKVLSYTTARLLAASHSKRRAGRQGGDVSINPRLYSGRCHKMEPAETLSGKNKGNRTQAVMECVNISFISF